jgi:hypothetical protein
MNTVVKFGMTLPHQVLQSMDEVRGDIPRTKYILRLVENALKEQQQLPQILPHQAGEGGGTTQK